MEKKWNTETRLVATHVALSLFLILFGFIGAAVKPALFVDPNPVFHGPVYCWFVGGGFLGMILLGIVYRK